MGIKIENNAASTLATSVGTSDVSLSLATGGGAKFPALGAGDYFWATLVSEFDPTYMEIVKVTARSTDTLTVVRAQEGTTAKTFQTGDKFEMRITAQTMRDYADAANITGTISISQGGTGGTTASAARTNLGLAIGSNVQAWDADLDAIAAISGTSGLLKKTGTNTWSLDSSAYLTGNQTITLSGDATGSGATSIAVTLANSGVTAGTYTKFTVDSKGRVTLGATLTSADLPTYTGTLTSGQVTNALTYTPENAANKGVASGYASLDASGKVPAVQLPSYVDDVVEAANLASFPGTGETGKIYVAIDSNKTYRWSGSAYVEISASPGTTDAVPEGSANLYFTTARARAAISASGSLAYNSSTGVLSFTDAVTSVAGKTGAVIVTSSDVGLGNVENKSSATIRGEITSGNVTTALGFTPYNSTNPSGYISGITSGMVTGALGYTPYNSTNPSGFITSSFSGFMLRSTSAQGNPSANFASSAYRFDPNANNPTNEHYAVVTYGNESNVVGQLATHFQSGQTFTRAYNSSWSSWRTQLDSGNYNSYSPTLTGGGASGTWGINVTGNAGSASSVAWTNVSGRPTAVSSFTNDSGYITGITSGMVTSALGYTPPQPSGTGASGTWGINITGNAATAYGLDVHTGRNSDANKVVRTDSNGYIQAGWINTTSGDNGTTAIDRVYASSDGYIRYYTPANFRSVLDVPTRTGGSASGTWSINITGNAGSASSVAWGNVSSKPDVVVNGDSSRSLHDIYNSGWFRNNNSGQGIYNQATANHFYSDGAYWNVGYAGTTGIRLRNGHAGTVLGYLYAETNQNFGLLNSSGNWAVQVYPGSTGGGNLAGGWTIGGATPLTSSNYTSYSPSLTGSGASGTWGINITGNAASVTNGLTTSNYSSYSSFSGLVSSSGNNGFANATYYSSVRNPIWSFGNASSYGISYFQGSAGRDGIDTITLHPNGSTSATGATFATNSNNAFVNNNVVLNASNYTSYSPSLGGSGASGTWGISITGNAATATNSSQLNGYGSAQSGANVVLRTASNGYLYLDNWLRVESAGVFSSVNSAHWSPNTGSYGAWRSSGSRNGWAGIEFDTGLSLMMNRNTVGIHDNSYGWTLYWSGGTGYVYKNANGGGTGAAILDSSNYTSYSPSLGGSGASGTWGINITGSAGSAGSVAASGITGQTGMWTSAARPGPYRLYRNEDNSAYNVQTTWSPDRSGYWSLRGYLNDSYHAPCFVAYSGYADSAGSVPGGLTTSNYNSYAVPVSGGTVTGTLTFTANVAICAAQGGTVRGYLNSDSSAFGFLSNGGSWAAYVPTGTLNWIVNGSITAGGNITAYSDERLKTDWQDVTSGFVERLASLKSGTYTRIDTKARHAGVSAQKVREFLPEVVEEDHKGNLTLAYGNAAMVSAVELAKEIVALKKELATIKYQLQRGE